jgi:CRISPR-associated protein Csh1
MLREIINFTEDLINDIPDILEWNAKPSTGLHVFIDVDENGQWVNQNLVKGKDYVYYDGKNENNELFKECIRYQNASDYITMNKVKKFDPKQKIHSCSPFSIAFNFNFSKEDKNKINLINKSKKFLTKEEKEIDLKKIKDERIKIVKERINDYKKFSFKIYFNNDLNNKYLSILDSFYNLLFYYILDEIAKLPEFQDVKEKDYVRIYLRSVPISEQEKLYKKYIEQEIFSDKKFTYNDKGVTVFLNSYSDKKIFLKHKTSSLLNGISYRIDKEDAILLYYFEKLIKNKILPNPLPIIIDNREINNEIIKIFNENIEPLKYSELIKKLFEKKNLSYLSDYYLLNYSNTKDGLVINDFDFVPLFRFYLDPMQIIYNITQSGIVKNKNFEKDNDIKIETIFEFERIVLQIIFNNSLIKIKDDKYNTSYFGNIDPKYVSGGDIMYQLILKYRKAFYDYIYKSKQNSINILIFDDIMYNSIISNIRKDEIKGKFEWNNNIKKKINIWFSLYNLFDNNQNQNNMSAKVKDLIEKIRNIAKGESNIETPEEFAFAAGQIISYLIDRSEASDKTYAMLEPYLQKVKSGLLQDAIAHTISIYKHDIHVSKGKFEKLASNVLTFDTDLDMKPLLKFFLAGCFSPCVIYEKQNNQ